MHCINYLLHHLHSRFGYYLYPPDPPQSDSRMFLTSFMFSTISSYSFGSFFVLQQSLCVIFLSPIKLFTSLLALLCSQVILSQKFFHQLFLSLLCTLQRS